jgi:transcriptional regulator with XRE-family HTH domain
MKRSAKERLRRIREAHDLSPEKFAVKVGCSGSAIRRYEADDPSVARVPNTEIACAIHEITEALGDPIRPRDWFN